MSEKNIYSKIIDFQKSMPTIKKDETNPFYKSKYATLDSIQKAIQEPLAKAGLGYTQQATQEGLKTTLFDLDGNTLEFIYPAVFAGKPQEIGSAMTYAKRYALTACLGLIIEGDDDDGNQAQESKQEVKKFDATNTVWMTQEQFEKLKTMIANNDNVEGVQAVIAKFSGAIVNSVKYAMKKEYREELKKALAKTSDGSLVEDKKPHANV